MLAGIFREEGEGKNISKKFLQGQRVGGDFCLKQKSSQRNI